MNTGLNLRIIGDIIGQMFEIDKYGSLIANWDNLQVGPTAESMRAQLSMDKTLAGTLVRKTYATDVEFAYRPYGSTPVIASGIRLFGPSPLKGLKYKGKLESSRSDAKNNEFLRRCSVREEKINNWVEDKIKLTEELPTKSEAEELLKEVEKDQIMTGGGYDGTEMFSITKSALDFLNKSAKSVDLKDTWRSELLMSEILKLREELWKELGNPLGKLRVTSLQVVRYLQDSDGMMGWPVYAKARIPLTKETAKRISINTGVSVFHLVDNEVRDENTKEIHQAYVVDAVCYALDHMVVRATDLPAIIHTLARIQRHGYKREEGKLVAKPGKARSVSPNAALPGAEEAMSFTSFLELCKDKEVHWLPSLQDHPTQTKLIRSWYENVLIPKEYRALAADWSGYDKTVDGSVLATIIYYIIRPLYHKDDQKWIDLAIVSLVYKYFIISKTAAKANPDLYQEVLKQLPYADVNDEFIIVGTINGLGSGAKLTHVGGSLYGECIIHHCLPRQLGWEPVSGPQAGDDTSLGVPLSHINLESVEDTYQPISDAAKEWNLELNVGKQMWVVKSGEPVNIFLQYSYHNNLNIWGIGTAARYSVAVPFAEKDNGLSISEQYMAVLSKLNNGWSSPFIKIYIRDWLLQDDFACILFKEYGVSAFDILKKNIGNDLQEITQRLDLTYNWGISTEDLVNGKIPVLPIIAEVARGMSPKMSIREAAKLLGEDLVAVADDIVDGPDLDADDDSD